jgi:general secretion pathway protein D
VKPWIRWPALVGLAAALALLGGCAAQRANTRGLTLIEQGDPEKGLAELHQAARLEPTNARYRLDFLNHQARLVQAALQRADAARAGGDMVTARRHYEAALAIDPANERVRRILAQLALDERQQAAIADAARLADAGRLDAAREKLRQATIENPSSAAVARATRQLQERLDAAAAERDAKIAATSVMKKPVTLQFRDANVRMVFEALSRTTGLNVIMDRDVRADLKTTIFVRDASVEDTVDLILLQNQLDKKVLNANTLFIYPATAAKQKEYQDLKVRTFQLSNADAKVVQNVLKSVLKVKDVALDDRTNTLVIRDTPDAIAVAEKIVLAHDLPDAEVMLEVEVMEVSRERLTNLGINWPEGATISTPTDFYGQLTLGQLRDLTSRQLLITPLSAGINLKLQDSDANLLASPRIRARHKEKARILIGDKVPVITSSGTPSGGVVVPSTSVQYLDVGIKLEVEPHVYLEGDVGIRMNLEVSNIVREIIVNNPGASTIAYQIGTRSASTGLRLRDGETQILGGLISDDDRNAASKVPGLGQLPVIGRLFGSHSGNEAKKEIVLAITPRIVRGAGLADARHRDVFSGSESAIRENPLRLDPVGAVGGSAASLPLGAPGTPRPGLPAPETPGATGGGASVAPGAAAPATSAPASPATPAAAPATTPGGGLGGASAPPGEGAAAPAPRPPSAAPPPADAPAAPANPEALPPSIRPGGIFKPAPPPQPAAPKPAPGPAPPGETVDRGGAPHLAGTPAAGEAAPLELAWQGPYRVKVGAEFQVALEITATRDIRTLPLTIRFDPLVLTFLDAQLAEFASKSGVAAVEPVVDAGGSVRLELRAGPGRSFRGQGVLLTLRFAARAPRQQTQLSITRFDLRGADGAVEAAVRPTPMTLRVGT